MSEYTASDFGLEYGEMLDYYQQNWFNMMMSQAETATSAMNPISTAGLNPYDPTEEQTVWSNLGLDLLMSDNRIDSLGTEAYTTAYDTGKILSKAGIRGNKASSVRTSIYDDYQQRVLEERRNQDKLVTTASRQVENIHQDYWNMIGQSYANWMAADPDLSDVVMGEDSDSPDAGLRWNLFMDQLAGAGSEASNRLIDMAYSWSTGTLDPTLQSEYDYFVQNFEGGGGVGTDPDIVQESITEDIWLLGQMGQQYHSIFGSAGSDAYSFGEYLGQLGWDVSTDDYGWLDEMYGSQINSETGIWSYNQDYWSGYADLMGTVVPGNPGGYAQSGFGAASEFAGDFGQWDSSQWNFYGFDYNPETFAGTGYTPSSAQGGGFGAGIGGSLMDRVTGLVSGEELDILYG